MQFGKTYDIVVAGAGVAGVAAALAAARTGKRTALVEKTVLTGGLATTGLINIYLPLCDGNGTQVTFGISEELLQRSIRYGPGAVPANWRDKKDAAEPDRYRTPFAPASFILALDEALMEAGVDVWLDTLVCAPILEGERITGLEVENKSGRGVLHAACTVDATGDADVAYRVGAPCGDGQNRLSLWSQEASLTLAEKALAKQDGTGLIGMTRLGSDNAGRDAIAGHRTYVGTTGRDVTSFVLEGRKLLRQRYERIQADLGEKGRCNHFPITLPSMAQFRTTRYIEGQSVLTDNQHGKYVEDSVGLVPDWRRPGPVWEIPYGTLLPQTVKGLLAAGRCIASTGDAWEVTRVIPVAAMTGEVAGVAAGLAIDRDTTPDALSHADVQAALRERGFPIHLTDVGL